MQLGGFHCLLRGYNTTHRTWQVLNTWLNGSSPASYSGGSGFKCQPRDQFFSSFSLFSSVPPGKCQDSPIN